MKKLIYSVLFLTAGAVSFTSCSDDDDADKFAMLNKTTFCLQNVGDKDTLYTENNGRYYLGSIVIYSDDVEVGRTSLKSQEKELKNKNEVIGSVEYSGGEVSRLVADDWFELKRISVKGHDKAYEVNWQEAELKATHSPCVAFSSASCHLVSAVVV